ncbi:Maf family protein [Paenibacillus sedimenti]|uniref:dTTP/UTP pyrophosphatase n=1 Tax=Paenibacillus sedimenti TaxID=2770274 RepID=A0A926QJM3_9BACL|nr:Maf family protein [Paenibacillus sedimenti]MBD0381685.1 Maf family protein [Paenibacillus sedimenti]
MSHTSHQTLILASSSPRRQELIQTLGLPYIIRVSDADETVEEKITPAELVELLSLRKATTVREMLPESEKQGIIIGSDTVVVYQGEVLGKPIDEEDSFRMLKALQGNTHEVYSGVACVNTDTGRSIVSHKGDNDNTMYLGDACQYRILSESASDKPGVIVGHSVSKVTFRPMSDEEIWGYITTGEPKDKAGAYGVQGLGSLFIEKIEGDFYSVMGLPMNLLYQMLLRFGISPFHN